MTIQPAGYQLGNGEDNTQFLNNLYQTDKGYLNLIKEEATKVAKETLNRGGGVIEYSMPNSLCDSIPRSQYPIHPVTKKGWIKPNETALNLFKSQVKDTAFDLLTEKNKA
jgi:hypothetical protein